jgi:O-methyltransferase
MLTEYEHKIRKAHGEHFLKVAGADFSKRFELVKDMTMLSRERLFDFYNSVKYINKRSIPGDVVEIGCWRGGGLAMAALADKDSDVTRKFVGVDTFEGHGRPDITEIDIWGQSQSTRFDSYNGQPWAKAAIDEVESSLRMLLGKCFQKIQLIKGKVEDLPSEIFPTKISILRIDVDWYTPTKSALEKLYDRVETNGIIIIDDYGHHSGARKAVDEFFAQNPVKWTYLDYSCITGQKS